MSVLVRLTTASVELTICVGLRDPFQSATHLPQKFVPVIVTDRAGLPATAVLGESAFRTGVLEFVLAVVCAAAESDKPNKKTNKKKNTKNFRTGVSPKRGDGAAG